MTDIEAKIFMKYGQPSKEEDNHRDIHVIAVRNTFNIEWKNSIPKNQMSMPSCM